MKEISDDEYRRLKEYENRVKFENALFTAYGVSIFIAFIYYILQTILTSSSLLEKVLGIIMFSLLLGLSLYIVVVYFVKLIKKKGGDIDGE